MFLASLNLPLVVGWGRGATDKATTVVVNDPGSTPAAEKKISSTVEGTAKSVTIATWALWHYGTVVMIIAVATTVTIVVKVLRS